MCVFFLLLLLFVFFFKPAQWATTVEISLPTATIRWEPEKIGQFVVSSD